MLSNRKRHQKLTSIVPDLRFESLIISLILFRSLSLNFNYLCLWFDSRRSKLFFCWFVPWWDFIHTLETHQRIESVLNFWIGQKYRNKKISTGTRPGLLLHQTSNIKHQTSNINPVQEKSHFVSNTTAQTSILFKRILILSLIRTSTTTVHHAIFSQKNSW